MRDPQVLLTDYFDGTLDAAGADELCAWVKQDPANAREVARAAMLHQGVRDLLYGRHLLDESGFVPDGLSETMVLPAVQDADAPEAVDDALPAPPMWAPARAEAAQRRRWPGIAAAILMVIGVGAVLWHRGHRSVPGHELAGTTHGTRPEVIEPAGVMLVAEIAAHWEGATPTVNGLLPEAELKLISGFAKLRFGKGVEVVVEGPARFIPRSSDVSLAEGKLTATVPPAGKGFTVRTATATIVDLGTEFGVASGGASTAVHVFVGEVTLAASRASGEAADGAPPAMVSLVKGEARRVDAGGTIAVVAPNAAQFVREQEFDRWDQTRQSQAASALERWRVQRDLLRRDPALMLYYPFGELDDSAATLGAELRNEALTAAGRWPIPTGGTVAPVRAQGRWPGKGALSFSSASRQHLTLPEYPPAQDGRLTVAAWVYARSTPALATIAKNWGDGTHGQFYLGLWKPNQHLAAQIGQADGGDVLVEDAEPFAIERWTHVVCVVDGKTLRLYRDGREVGVVPCIGVIARPKSPAMGIGYKPGDDGATPSASHAGYWDGLIDELAIFHKALSQQEVQNMFESGKPN